MADGDTKKRKDSISNVENKDEGLVDKEDVKRKMLTTGRDN